MGKKTLDILEEAGGENGLKLSDEKAKILRIKGPGTSKKIGRFKIEEEAKYLGVMIGGRGRNIFEAENKAWLEKAEKKANSIIGLVNKSADRVIVGKAMWKMIAIPALLFGRAVVTTTKRNIKKLQIIENRVWRYLLGIEDKRNYDLINKKLRDPEERMRALLFRNENHQEVGRMIKALWDLRDKMLKDRKIIMKNKQKKPQKDERRNIK